MDSNQILLKFETIKSRLSELVFKLNDTEEKLRKTEEEIVRLKNLIKQQELSLKNLHKTKGNEQKDFVKKEFFHKLVKNTGSSSDDKDDLKRTLDEYIKEIESCIAQLSN
jgi:hypothetical protein